MVDDTELSRPPVEDGWEPEKSRRGPIDWCRDHPAGFFGILGSILFVGGWGVSIYLAVSNGAYLSAQSTEVRLQVLVSMGSTVTLASGVLWAIAVYIWIHLLPEAPTDQT